MSRCFWCLVSYFFLSNFFLCLVSSCVWSPVVCCQVVRYLVLSVSSCAWCLAVGEGEHSDPVKCWRRPSSRPAAADLVPEAPSEFRLPKCAQYAHPNALWRCVDFFFVLFGCLYFFGPFYDFYFIYEWLRLVCLNAVDFFYDQAWYIWSEIMNTWEKHNNNQTCMYVTICCVACTLNVLCIYIFMVYIFTVIFCLIYFSLFYEF